VVKLASPIFRPWCGLVSSAVSSKLCSLCSNLLLLQWGFFQRAYSRACAKLVFPQVNVVWAPSGVGAPPILLLTSQEPAVFEWADSSSFCLDWLYFLPLFLGFYCCEGTVNHVPLLLILCRFLSHLRFLLMCWLYFLLLRDFPGFKWYFNLSLTLSIFSRLRAKLLSISWRVTKIADSPIKCLLNFGV